MVKVLSQQRSRRRSTGLFPARPSGFETQEAVSPAPAPGRRIGYQRACSIIYSGCSILYYRNGAVSRLSVGPRIEPSNLAKMLDMQTPTAYITLGVLQGYPPPAPPRPTLKLWSVDGRRRGRRTFPVSPVSYSRIDLVSSSSIGHMLTF